MAENVLTWALGFGMAPIIHTLYNIYSNDRMLGPVVLHGGRRGLRNPGYRTRRTDDHRPDILASASAGEHIGVASRPMR